MSRLEELEIEIGKLAPEDFARLREWFLERDWADWDEQIKRDSQAGKLDQLINRALADHAAGKSKPV